MYRTRTDVNLTLYRYICTCTFECALSVRDSTRLVYCICDRLISENTVEENILKKANQKRLLNEIAIEGGKFTTATLKQVSIYEYLYIMTIIYIFVFLLENYFKQ